MSVAKFVIQNQEDNIPMPEEVVSRSDWRTSVIGPNDTLNDQTFEVINIHNATAI